MNYRTGFLCSLTVALIGAGCGNDYSSTLSPRQEKFGENTGSCSKLDFHNYQWPKETFGFENEAFKIALNITSTFEGHEEWKNLTNNFDGQGLSMGLLNQTLGTGSLQPLLIQFRNKHMNLLKGIFSTARLNSLLEMLRRWENLKSTEGRLFSASPLDENFDDFLLLASSEDSVKWAKNNLYRWNGEFIPAWKLELQTLLETPEYIAIQIQAAWILHRRAVALFEQMNVPQLRTYLLMFDFVVQNGTIYLRDWDDYYEFVQKNPQATDNQRLEKILELRLRHVKPQWVNNVRMRKASLINGRGRVNGFDRDYEREYCFNRLMKFPTL